MANYERDPQSRVGGLAVDKINEAAHWVISEEQLDRSKMNLIGAIISYTFLFLVCIACYKKRVSFIRLHDSVLIMMSAFVLDLIEMRLHVHLLLEVDSENVAFRDWHRVFVPTSVATCTISVSLISAHILLSYIETAVSIRRFLVIFCKKFVPIYVVYAMIGVVCVAKVAFVIINIQFGKVTTSELGCSRIYYLKWTAAVWAIFWVVSLLATPILSLLTVIRQWRTPHTAAVDHEMGTTLFVLTSSLSMIILVVAIMIDVASPNAISRIVMNVTALWQEFRLLVLLLLCVAFIADIRGAVISSLIDVYRRLRGVQVRPSLVHVYYHIRGIQSTPVSSFSNHGAEDLHAVEGAKGGPVVV